MLDVMYRLSVCVPAQEQSTEKGQQREQLHSLGGEASKTELVGCLGKRVVCRTFSCGYWIAFIGGESIVSASSRHRGKLCVQYGSTVTN